MKGNSIEEDIERLKLCSTNQCHICGRYEKEECMLERNRCEQHILSDYKRVLKENEELLQEKINNQKIIALAQKDMLNYQAGFEDGKNRRTSAVQSIIENQQYYIFQKQIEKYERHIEKLQKENEELKNKYATFIKMSSEVIANSILKSKLKDIIDRIDYDIKKTKEIISKNTNIYASYRKNDYQIVRLRAMNTKSLDIKNRLQKLLESEE